MDDGAYRIISLAGFFTLAGAAWITGGRKKVNAKTAAGSVLLAWALGGLTFWASWSRTALEWINTVLLAVLNASQKGSVFLFGPLALGPGRSLTDGTPSIGFVLAFQVLQW